jgi:peptide/nickel transport system permease protein
MVAADPRAAHPPMKRHRFLRGLLSHHRSSRLDKAALVGLAAVTVVVLAAPLLVPYDPIERVAQPFLPPGSGRHVLGTDELGRDLTSRVLIGARSTWFAALAVIASGVIIGGFIGAVAGVVGGWVDALLMRVTDLFLSLPGPILAIAVVAALGPSLRNTLVAVSVVWWPLYARIVRGEVHSLATRPHVEAARLAGASRWRLARRHLLPGAVPAVLVGASLDVGLLVLALAGLSFLGLGAPAPAPELGAMTARGITYLLEFWWIPIIPGLAVAALAMVANLAGDAVRDLLEDR